jgi:hypothetical protein
VNGNERDDVYRRFRGAVNMNARQLRQWLDTDASKTVGQRPRPGVESTGHRSGRRIVGLLGTDKTRLSDADLAHMRKVAGYVARHLAQRPSGDVRDTRWRYSLMNWGHDPLR